jgi:hypothetical protein
MPVLLPDLFQIILEPSCLLAIPTDHFKPPATLPTPLVICRTRRDYSVTCRSSRFSAH